MFYFMIGTVAGYRYTEFAHNEFGISCDRPISVLQYCRIMSAAAWRVQVVVICVCVSNVVRGVKPVPKAILVRVLLLYSFYVFIHGDCQSVGRRKTTFYARSV